MGVFRFSKRLSYLLSLVLALFTINLQASPASSARALLVVAPQKLADGEYRDTRAVLEKKGITVKVASVSLAVCTGYGDIKVQPDVTIDQAQVKDFDALVLIGGDGAVTYLVDHMGLRKLIQQSVENKRVVAAICAAPVVLARAGILKGKTATVYKDNYLISQLKEGGAKYKDIPAVADGLLVTGNGPDASKVFGAKVAEVLLAAVKKSAN